MKKIYCLPSWLLMQFTVRFLIQRYRMDHPWYGRPFTLQEWADGAGAPYRLGLDWQMWLLLFAFTATVIRLMSLQ